MTRETMTKEETVLRTEILTNAIDQSADKLRRDTAVTSYLVAAVQTLRAINHPVAFHMMNDLAFNINGKDSFTKACKLLGRDVPAAVEQATRKPRIVKKAA